MKKKYIKISLTALGIGLAIFLFQITATRAGWLGDMWEKLTDAFTGTITETEQTIEQEETGGTAGEDYSEDMENPPGLADAPTPIVPVEPPSTPLTYADPITETGGINPDPGQIITIIEDDLPDISIGGGTITLPDPDEDFMSDNGSGFGIEAGQSMNQPAADGNRQFPIVGLYGQEGAGQGNQEESGGERHETPVI